MSATFSYDAAELIASNPPEGFEPIDPTLGFGVRNGPIFEKVCDKTWARGFRVLEKHINKGKICHGGMMMTFADIVAARAVHEVAGFPFVTMRLTTDFVSAGKLGSWLEGRARAIEKGNSVAFVEGEITSGDTLVMSFSGMFKLIGKRK